MSTSTQAKEMWNFIKESQKEREKIRKEREKIRKEREKFQKEREKSRKEWEKGMQELRKTQRETSEKIQETSEQMKRTDKKLNKYIGDTGNYWGKLGENLVKGNLAKRLREKGIEVEKVITNAKFSGVEFDIIAINGKETVIVEVKATLDPSDVDKFKENMEQFKTLWPEFKDKTVYGAIAFLLKSNRQAESLAEKEGFFVISATGDVIIKNKKSFKPKAFS